MARYQTGSQPRLHVVEGGHAAQGDASVGEDASVDERSRAEAAMRRRVVQAQAGDARAWEQLYLSHYRELLRFCSYATGSVDTAEDTTQEAFARALAGLAQYDERAAFSAWLRGIALNLLRKQWRKGERRTRAYAKVESAPGHSEHPDERLVRDRRAEALDTALGSLPPPLREAFVLTDVQGLPASEAAALAGTTPGNIRVRATRARARLQKELTRAGQLTAEGRAR